MLLLKVTPIVLTVFIAKNRASKVGASMGRERTQDFMLTKYTGVICKFGTGFSERLRSSMKLGSRRRNAELDSKVIGLIGDAKF